MAIKFSNALQCTNSTAALFRAWVQFIDDTLLVAGTWVNTADTGQMTIASAAAPVGANSKIGYRVYKMGDALQATAPCFMRLDYGSGSATNTPGIWITIGTGSNGSGTITGLLFNGGGSATPQVMTGINDTTACNSYSAAGSNWVAVMLFVRSAGNDLLIFNVERSKDASTGADTGAGFLIGYGDTTTGYGVCGYLISTPGSQPSIERPQLFLSNSSAFGSNVGIGLIGYFNGVLQPFGLTVIGANSADFSAESPVTMTLYGSAHTFQLGNTGTNQLFIATGAGNGTARIGCRIGIRYE